ncbi:MAG TPA: hypothetical protein VM370_02915 [Candidatus Thermoplasmatota archaeon]|nr:hypothetical protein [Candidatus Thermoplasmatota archaeon]
MRFAPILVLAFVLAAPLASAEKWNLRGGGATIGAGSGVAALQWDDDSGVGMRYWLNATGDGSGAVVLTTCVVPDSHVAVYCERQWVTA